MMNDTKGKMTYINVDETNETLHLLWSTPVVMAKPFDDNFVKEIREEAKSLLEPGQPANYNSTDIWQLPNLSPNMLKVKEKFLELFDKHFRPLSEMPMPEFRAWKGYFRVSSENGPYLQMPHKHAQTFGVGIFYITAQEDNPGNLVLIDPRGGVNWMNQFTAFKKIRVEEGMMVIHPGYLLHYVEPSDPSKNMYYGNRLALITNLSRTYKDFIKVLADEEVDKKLNSMIGSEL
jgi:hypothetical protein